MIPFVENNYNCCELGPKSTGKSHIYKEISPNSILISGGQTTVANLFYNLARRQVGLVGHEMSHFSFYQSKSSGGLFLVAIKYMTSKKYHYSFERGADTTAIARGLGWQLLDMGIYMRRDEIRDLMEKKGYFGEGLDIGYLFRRREENDL
jgi:hypothetical protein